MKRNVTVSLDEEMARWVRVQAAREDVSVSQFLAHLLEERRHRTEGYEAARDAFLSRRPRRLRRGGGPLPRRDEVHVRSAPPEPRPNQG